MFKKCNGKRATGCINQAEKNSNIIILVTKLVT